ncbi:4-(cytidine 5'-diphospho)-2-C-methyl-D-erythritol kinase [Sphingomonas bacterium]|uniref:4-(cytidine 5'-diphospho)-2-C-methyl-D-erythritol kinase n=1 Tax=Sphingomonas bacterium TaxID=1895847 RepID=UPI00261B4805|nr:4-(cytidine 5'-diphospho)-2-C-methyl-D-erythritol kinase [Sphingomonas bacterium]
MIVETAPAKINLALHIRRKRSDGYHDLETIFAFARDGDVVTATPAERDGFDVVGPFAIALTGAMSSSPAQTGAQSAARALIPASARGGRNLVTKAALAFRATFAVAQPHAITLDKRLPVASGIGGGSADAAATLRALARLHEIDPQDARLFAIAETLGADVPACLLGRPAFGTGKGERLDPLPLFGDLPLLLVNPRVGLATAPMFAGWDGQDRGGIADGGTVLARAAQGRNDFTAPAIAAAPIVGEVLTLLERAEGSCFARMSGSGATCFALFDSIATRDRVASEADRRGWWTLPSTLI